MRIARRKFAKSSAYRSGAIVRCRQGKIWKDIKESEIDTLQEATLEEKETLRTWFKRKGAPGKEGGWVDCNTCRDGKCKACGRKKGGQKSSISFKADTERVFSPPPCFSKQGNY